MASLIQEIVVIIFVYASIWFLISLILKRNDVADIAWGLGFIVISVYLWWKAPVHTVGVLLYGLVFIWALRLAAHITLRSLHKTEDFRYKNWRQAWGKHFYIRSFFQVYVLQGFFMVVISSPLLVASQTKVSTFSLFTVVGVLIWCIGFVFEAVGDFQLQQFIKQKRHTSEIMQTGLWKYTRHPNYFGEVMLWWGIFIIVSPLPLGIWAIISPITITYLLLYVSGIPMLEAKYKNNVDFERYKARTSAFFPWPPQKNR